jgi:predicted nuclease with TOPRIM domain
MELGPAEIAAIVGVVGAIVGGVGGKAFDNYMEKRKMGMDLASQIRSEQRAEVLTLRSELDDTEENLDEWREKYYELKEENVRQQTMMDGLQDQINDMKKLGE